MSDFENIEMNPAPSEESEEKVPQVRFTPFTGINKDLEVEVSDVPIEGETQEKTLEQVETELEETKAKLDLQQQGGNTADAVRLLAEQLKGPNQQQHQMPLFLQEAGQEVTFSEEEEKKLAEKAYEGGFISALDQYNEKKLRPEKAKQIANNLYMGQKFVESDPEMKEFNNKYRAEIQQVINSTPLEKLYALQDPYKEAYNYVLQQHQGEVIQSRISEQVAKGVEDKLKEMGYTPKTNPQAAQSFTEGGVRPGPAAAAAPTKIRLTTKEETDRLRRGMTSGNYNAFVKRNPKYREKLNASNR